VTVAESIDRPISRTQWNRVLAEPMTVEA